MQAVDETRQTQTTKQMNKSLSLACAKKLSEHEALLAKLQSIVLESLPALQLRQTGHLNIVEIIKRVFFAASMARAFWLLFCGKKVTYKYHK